MTILSSQNASAQASTGAEEPSQIAATAANPAAGAAPSWISSLTDPVIKADMTAAAASGTVTEAGMAKLFTDLAAELATNNSKLSSSQLADLKTIAADLNVGETASSYVTYVTDALIDGNAANSKWTGGAASASTLGNLAVGTTATQLSELTGKWFLGTDLPSDYVNLSGESAFTVSYSAVSNPLFGASGPSINDINQGELGDCYLLSSLAEVARQNPTIIDSMITNNGNNTYGVRFYVDGTAEYVTVNNSLADGGTAFNDATDIWASLVEKAYAQAQASGLITDNDINDGNSYSTIGNGGAPEYALEEITGASAITDFQANGSTWEKVVYNGSLDYESSNSGMTTATVLSTLAADLAKGYDEILSSNTDAFDSAGRDTLISDHAMSIYGYDSTTGDLEIRNPWGSESWQYWDTTFEVSLNTLLSDGDTISVDNMAPPTATADLNGNGMSDILWSNSNGDTGYWEPNGSGGFTSVDLGIVPSSWQIAGTGDFTANGYDDILWRNSNGDTGYWEPNGSGGFTSVDLGIAPTGWQIAGTGDFTGNGTDDILWRNTNGDTGIWEPNGSGGFTSVDLGIAPTSWQIAGTGDFTGTGTDDILWRNTNGDTGIWEPNSSGGFTSVDLGIAPTSWQIAGVGDFTGNGTDDILWRNTNGDTGIWEPNSSGGFTSVDLGIAPTSWQIAGVGDFTGNGTDDILWRNTNGDTGIWTPNKSGGFTSTDLGIVPTSWTIKAA